MLRTRTFRTTVGTNLNPGRMPHVVQDENGYLPHRLAVKLNPPTLVLEYSVTTTSLLSAFDDSHAVYHR